MFLSGARRRTLAALLARIAPHGSPLADDATLAAAEELLAASTSTGKRGLQALLFVLEWLPPAFALGRDRRTFSELDDDGRVRLLERLLALPFYPLRGALRALVALCVFSHYSRPGVRQAIGFDPAARVAYARATPNPEGSAVFDELRRRAQP